MSAAAQGFFFLQYFVFSAGVERIQFEEQEARNNLKYGCQYYALGRPSPHHRNLQRQRGNAQQPRTNPHKPSVPPPPLQCFPAGLCLRCAKETDDHTKSAQTAGLRLRIWPRSFYVLGKMKGRGQRGGVRGGAGTRTRLPGCGGIPAPARPRRLVVRDSRVLGLALAPPPSASSGSHPTSAHLTR